MTADSCFEGASVTDMTQKRVTRALSVGVFALLVGPLVVPASSHAATPTAKPGEILDFPTCDGIPLDPHTKWGGKWTDNGKWVRWWPDLKLGSGIYWAGSGSTIEEARYTEKLGNVAAHIITSRAPKGTTRFQLRYWTGIWGEEEGPFHAKFFKKAPIRAQIPDAKFDTYYSLQIVALKGDCIAYATGVYAEEVWCSVKKKPVTIGFSRELGLPIVDYRCPKVKN